MDNLLVRCRAGFAILALMILLTVVLALHQNQLVSMKYDNAKTCLEQEQFDEALNSIESIMDYEHYKDAALLHKKAVEGKRYNEALEKFELGDYESAKTMFANLGDYKESALYLARSEVRSIDDARRVVYDEAYSLYKNKHYQEALEEFISLGSYKDSKKLANTCKSAIVKE